MALSIPKFLLSYIQRMSFPRSAGLRNVDRIFQPVLGDSFFFLPSTAWQRQ